MESIVCSKLTAWQLFVNETVHPDQYMHSFGKTRWMSLLCSSKYATVTPLI